MDLYTVKLDKSRHVPPKSCRAAFDIVLFHYKDKYLEVLCQSLSSQVYLDTLMELSGELVSTVR